MSINSKMERLPSPIVKMAEDRKGPSKGLPLFWPFVLIGVAIGVGVTCCGNELVKVLM